MARTSKSRKALVLLLLTTASACHDMSKGCEELEYWIDEDDDGYVVLADGYEDIELIDDPRCVAVEEDCDDNDATIHSGAVEVCDGIDNDCDGTIDNDVMTDEVCDGIDNDCDGTIDEDDASDASTWYRDADEDGYGDTDVSTTACEASEGYVSSFTDCDDATPSVNPDADEVCDGVDNDCDGLVDSDDPVFDRDYYLWEDRDGDGFGSHDFYGADIGLCFDDEVPVGTDVDEHGNTYTFGYVDSHDDCDDTDPYIYPGAEELDDDGADNNCDGNVEVDADGDGWYDLGGDCRDDVAHIHPGVTEICNGVDDNCDGNIDGNDALDSVTSYRDADGDKDGDVSTVQNFCTEEEANAAGYVWDNDDCDDSDPEINSSAVEVCDTLDNDCDGKEDENDVCEDGDGTGTDADSDGFDTDTDCDDADAAINPDAIESCDAVDNDCDGTVDEDDASDVSPWYADSDEDGYGDASIFTLSCTAPSGSVSDDTDCDDGDDGINPAATEIADDGVDQDCDGSDLSSDPDEDGDGHPASTDCDDSRAWVNSGVTSEECWLGTDADCDGSVGYGDTDCSSTGAGANLFDDAKWTFESPIGTGTVSGVGTYSGTTSSDCATSHVDSCSLKLEGPGTWAITTDEDAEAGSPVYCYFSTLGGDASVNVTLALYRGSTLLGAAISYEATSGWSHMTEFLGTPPTPSADGDLTVSIRLSGAETLWVDGLVCQQ